MSYPMQPASTPNATTPPGQHLAPTYPGQPTVLDVVPIAPATASAQTTITIPVGVPMYRFDGGAANYFGASLAAALVTVFTLGICLPWAVVILQRWQTKHTYLWGRRMRFTGTAAGLFGHWIKWWALCLVTFGIYSFWVQPRLTRWIVEHQAFDTAA